MTAPFHDNTNENILKKHQKEESATVCMSNSLKCIVILYIPHFYLDFGWPCQKFFSPGLNEMGQTLKNELLMMISTGKPYYFLLYAYF